MRFHKTIGALAAALGLTTIGGAQAPHSTESNSGAPPVGVHQAELERHRDEPTSPGLIGARGTPILPLQPRAARSSLCSTVFGYLPYWESADHLDYDLLTHVACFSVEVNSNGTLGNDHGWPWTSVINQAHANGVKVILVATLFNSTNILTLITNSTYKNTFFQSIKAKMLEGSADGLNIDFEGGGSAWKAHINAFMADLTAYLHTELPGSEVTFAGPAVNWGSDFDLQGLADACDGIFIMGYAFWGSWSSTSGPNSPLVGGSYDITNTVLTQYASVTANNPEKLILGIPYYGHHWTTTSSAPRASAISFQGSTWFRNDEPNSATYGLLWDTVSETPWYRWQVGSTWHQVWFDNATSLGLKYDLALNNNLQGVGMWALGYDGNRPELWDLIAQKFGTCSTFPSTPFCQGHGSGVGCPCFNPPPVVNDEGCANGSGMGAFLSASGEASVSADTLELTVHQATPSDYGIFVQNIGVRAAAVPFYNGLFCLNSDGHLIRHYAFPSVLPTYTDSIGRGTNTQAMTLGDHLGDTQPGVTMYYQFWYRDSVGFNPLCTAGANFSSGLYLTWLPSRGLPALAGMCSCSLLPLCPTDE